MIAYRNVETRGTNAIHVSYLLWLSLHTNEPHDPLKLVLKHLYKQL